MWVHRPQAAAFCELLLKGDPRNVDLLFAPAHAVVGIPIALCMLGV